MKTRTGFSLAVLATAILLLCQLITPAVAQDQGPPEPPPPGYDQDQSYQGQPDQDPPTRAGRISFTEGSVSFQPGGQGDWVSAVPNRPLTTGDNLWVDQNSRAEIQIGGTSIRLGPQTSVTFLDLGDNVTQLRLSLGSLYFRVRHFGSDDNFEVDTPNLAFNVTQPGEFRLDVDQNGDQTVATVWRGAGEVTGGGNSYRMNEGQEGTFSGTDQLSYDVGDIQSPDDFGRWCLSRDQREDRAESRQYVSDDMTGYEDLDDYGRWQSTPDYGNVWVPTGVPVGWAPYRYGHWAYVYPWGWTWVEDEPWGFAPFHYGRWAFYSNSWCWVPGPVVVRPVYAPALVAFVGGFSIGVGTAPVGWFPLGPREVYVPWYRTSPRYVQNVNVTNTRVTVVQVNNVYNNYTVNHVTNVTYVNRSVRNSVTVVNQQTFVNARPVNQNLQRIDERQLASARVTPAVVNRFQPARQSVVGVAHPVQYHPPAQALSRPVVATRQPVVYRRAAAAAPQFARPAAPPPVRTVKPAPAAQAQTLRPGARGGPQPPAPRANNPGNRPGEPNNAGPAQPANGPNRGAPRPGAPANNPEAGRPAPENNRNVPRPGAPANNNNMGRPNDNAPRPGANNNNMGRPHENVPRPGGPANNNVTPRPNENAPRPGAAPENRPPQPDNRPTPPENNRQENNRPENNRNVPRPPSASQPEQQPRQYPGTRPENNRPQESPQARPEQQNRPQEVPQQQSRPPETPQMRPEEPARTPPNRQETAPPRQPENRPAPPPSARDNERYSPRPEARPAAPPREARPAAPPAREARPAPEARPQHESKPPKDSKPPDKRDHGKGR